MMRHLALSASCVLAHAGSASASPEFVTVGGVEYATVSASNNAPFPGIAGVPPGTEGTLPAGAGVVNYDYRIARTEVVTGDWLEFRNTFSVRSGARGFADPVYWGADRTIPIIRGGERSELNTFPANSDPANEPVLGISWIEAAMYCNWLHNGRTDREEDLRTGAYDLPLIDITQPTTYGYVAIPWEDRAPMPGAKYRLPTDDEWLKAAFFRPDETGTGGSWDEHPYGLDRPPVPGAPGVGETSAGTFYDYIGNFGQELDFPSAGAFADFQSYYGLWDISGGGGELVRLIDGPFNQQVRVMGSNLIHNEFERAIFDTPGALTSWSPLFGSGFSSLRLVTTIPTPSTCIFALTTAILFTRRR